MRAKDIIGFALICLFWGSSFLWIKIVLTELGPITLVAIRLTLGALGLGAALAIRRPPLPRAPRIWLSVALLGALNPAAPFFLITWGEQYIDSGVASILNATVPLFTLVIAHFALDDERITLPRAAGLLVGFGGIVLLVGRDLGVQGVQGSVLGGLAVVVAALCYAIAAVVARKVLRDMRPVVFSTVTVSVGASLMWALVPLAEAPVHFPVSGPVWIGLAFMGLLGTCGAYLLYYSLIQSIGATRATLVTYVIPVVGVLLGVIVLREELSWSLAVSAALIIGSVAIVNSRQLQPARATSGD